MNPYETYMTIQKEAGLLDATRSGLGAIKRTAGEIGATVKGLAADLEHTRSIRKNPGEMQLAYDARMAGKSPKG